MGLQITADIATVLIIIQTIITLLVPVALVIFAARGMILVNRKLKVVMPQIQGYARQLSIKSDQVSKRIAEPVIKREAKAASRNAMRDHAVATTRVKLQKSPHPSDEIGGTRK